MRYMLDTDICSYIMKAASRPLLETMQDKVEGGSTICISVISYAELRLGAERSVKPKHYHMLIDELSERLDFIANWSKKEADRFAKLQSTLLSRGTPIGNNDTMIAAHAIAIEATLISNNTKHFSKALELKLENWL